MVKRAASAKLSSSDGMAEPAAVVVQHRPWSETDDHGLMRQVARGNKLAFTELARRYMPAMHGFARRYVGAADADDIVQESLTRIWVKATQWQDRGVSPRSWAMRIVYNRCMDILRRPQHDAMAQGEEPVDVAAGPEQLYENAIRDRQLDEALAKLPERQRSAILLTVFHTLSNREVAEVLGVSTRALESLLSRGRRGLKSLLRQQDISS